MESATTGDPSKAERQKISRLNARLKRSGIHAGVPIIEPGDDFIFSDSNSSSMRALKELVRNMLADQEGADQSTETTSVPQQDAATTPEPVVRNSWYTIEGTGAGRKQFAVRIIEVNPEAPERERRVKLEKEECVAPAKERFQFAMKTILKGKVSTLLTAERRALTKLKEIVTPAVYQAYLLTDAVLEVGKSGVFYLIRKNRPTIAMRTGEKDLRLLCALCLHPIGYFNGTWAGALPPTDEVVAHLLLIRSDERRFWKEANQIPIDEANSGV